MFQSAGPWVRRRRVEPPPPRNGYQPTDNCHGRDHNVENVQDGGTGARCDHVVLMKRKGVRAHLGLSDHKNHVDEKGEHRGPSEKSQSPSVRNARSLDGARQT